MWQQWWRQNTVSDVKKIQALTVKTDGFYTSLLSSNFPLFQNSWHPYFWCSNTFFLCVSRVCVVRVAKWTRWFSHCVICVSSGSISIVLHCCALFSVIVSTSARTSRPLRALVNACLSNVSTALCPRCPNKQLKILCASLVLHPFSRSGLSMIVFLVCSDLKRQKIKYLENFWEVKWDNNRKKTIRTIHWSHYLLISLSGELCRCYPFQTTSITHSGTGFRLWGGVQASAFLYALWWLNSQNYLCTARELCKLVSTWDRKIQNNTKTQAEKSTSLWSWGFLFILNYCIGKKTEKCVFDSSAYVCVYFYVCVWVCRWWRRSRVWSEEKI